MNTLLHFLLLCQSCRSLRSVSFGGRILDLIKVLITVGWEWWRHQRGPLFSLASGTPNLKPTTDRSRHSLQAKRCLHMRNSVFRSWSMHIMHCIRCCRLAIWLPVCCCRSSGGVFEKYWRILLYISLVMVRCYKRVRVCPGWTICPNARQGRSLLKHRICSCKNRW